MSRYTTELKMQQGWLKKTQRHLLPATVRVGWTAKSMLVEAVLQDADMFNPVKKFNDAAFEKGDVFEIFLRPEGQLAYYEFHVTPENQVLQLRIPSAREFRQPKPGRNIDEKIAAYKVWTPRLRTRVKRGVKQWTVNVTIPFSMVVEKGRMKRGVRWFCSFCRYDYTRRPKRLILSSTSPHKECNYHHQQEWIPIVYQP